MLLNPFAVVESILCVCDLRFFILFGFAPAPDTDGCCAYGQLIVILDHCHLFAWAGKIDIWIDFAHPLHVDDAIAGEHQEHGCTDDAHPALTVLCHGHHQDRQHQGKQHKQDLGEDPVVICKERGFGQLTAHLIGGRHQGHGLFDDHGQDQSTGTHSIAGQGLGCEGRAQQADHAKKQGARHDNGKGREQIERREGHTQDQQDQKIGHGRDEQTVQEFAYDDGHNAGA